MTHVVQFTNLSDFIADLAAGETAAVYHELIEQRTATTDFGMTRWLKTTAIRALVANDKVVHVAALTIPHGHQVDRINGVNFDPRDNESELWKRAGEEHRRIVDELEEHLAQHGLLNTARNGILSVPADLSLVLAPLPWKLRVEEVAPAE